MKNITFSADEDAIELAREQAQADNTTLNEQFRLWLQEYAQRRRAARALETVKSLRQKYATGGRKFSRDEMNER